MEDYVRHKMLLDDSVRSLTESRSLNDTKRGHDSLHPPAPLNPKLLAGTGLINYMNTTLSSSKDNNKCSPTTCGKHNAGPLQKKARISPAVVAKARFPCPSLSEKEPKPASLGLTEYRKTWERLERMSDMMDDTAEDQEAFIKEFFIRSLHKRKRSSYEL
jgi:hypothetical protein